MKNRWTVHRRCESRPSRIECLVRMSPTHYFHKQNKAIDDVEGRREEGGRRWSKIWFLFAIGVCFESHRKILPNTHRAHKGMRLKPPKLVLILFALTVVGLGTQNTGWNTCWIIETNIPSIIAATCVRTSLYQFVRFFDVASYSRMYFRIEKHIED